MLSSVFYRPPEEFVKKIRDRINERLDLETQGEAELIGGAAAGQEEYVDSEGVKRSQYVQEAAGGDYQAYAAGKQGDLLDLDDGPKAAAAGTLDDILGTGPSSNTGSASGGSSGAGEGSILDLIDTSGPAVGNAQSPMDLLDDIMPGSKAMPT